MSLEHYLKPTDKVWIGENQGESIPPGTFCRLNINYDEKLGIRTVTFKQHNQVSISYQLQTPHSKYKNNEAPLIHVDLRPFISLPDPNRRISPTELNSFKEIRLRQSKNDISQERVYNEMRPRYQEEIDHLNAPFITGEDLKKVGNYGFTIKNCGAETPFLSDSIVYIVKDSNNNRITIVFLDENNALQTSSYITSKIYIASILASKKTISLDSLKQEE